MKKTNNSNLAAFEHQMAIKFEETITASKLARWVGVTNEQMQSYVIETNEGDTGISFLNAINWALLPGLINCKNKEERVAYLKVELPIFLDMDDNKRAICEIGQSFMHNFKTMSEVSDNDCNDCMDILKVFIAIIQIYYNYSYERNVLRKAA